MSSILQFLRKYGLAVLFLLLVGVAFIVPKQADLKSSANILEEYISGSQDKFDALVMGKANEWEVVSKLKLYSYENDSLVFYSDNSVLPKLSAKQYDEGASLSKLRNGWYLLLKKSDPNHVRITIGLVPIKYDYRFENQFLKNEFPVDLKIPSNFTITEDELKGSVPVRSREGNVLLRLYSDETKNDSEANVGLVLLYVFIFLIVFYYLQIKALQLVKSHGSRVAVSFLLFSLVAIRLGMIWFVFPAEFHKLELFNPTLYASSWFTESLGDLCISCAFLFWVVLFSFKLERSFSLFLFPARFKNIEKVLLVASIFASSAFLLWLFKTMVLDSLISFQVYDILSLSIYSLIGLVCITIVVIAHFLIALKAVRRLIELNVSLGHLMLISLIAALSFSLFSLRFQYPESVLFTIIWTYVFVLIAFKVFQEKDNLRSTKTLLTFILLYSILSMFLIENLYEKKERNQREFFANKLVSSHDYIAEFTFSDIADRIARDRYIKSYFSNPLSTRKDLRDRIASLYFNGYFSKYDLQVFVYDTFNHALKANDTIPFSYFKNLLHEKDSKSSGIYLQYVSDSSINASYLSIVPIVNDSLRSYGNLVLYFYPKMYNGQNVYPELLLGQNVTSVLDNFEYNFAIYQKDKLVMQQGDFPYSYYWDKAFDRENSKKYFFESKEWEHLVCNFGNDRKVIVSIPQEGFFEPVATVSYFFSIYFLIITLFLTVVNFYKLFKENRSLVADVNMSFRTRINYSMLLIIIVSFIIIGIVTISFFKNQYDGFYTDRLLRKEKTILASIEFYLQENIPQNSESKISKTTLEDLLNIELSKLSEIHNIDINVFDSQGELATSSQPAIFDNGLVSKRMQPKAFEKMSLANETQFIQQENIGRLNYTAIYAPIRNAKGITLAYLSVPYFEKSKTINDEVSAFLVTLMNAYVFLLLCAAVLAYFISNSITRPLRFISEKLRILNLNKKNEPIEWKSKDEIGVLIGEYNKMINQLEGSASKLARSERESAWREMARQIAHEIKNPLTPMKLSIQYLQRALEEGNPNVNDLARKVSKTMIEQIENLSSIATAFASFAQMPKSNSEPLDLNDLLKGIIGLFEKDGNVEISFSSYKEKAMIFADKNQMISVFNNLIKNAIQSVPEGVKGNIMVITLEEYGCIKTVVMDNGSGIPKESYEKVFVPNFTTKSSGTGLGLAITKQIVENANGQIWFESEMGTGTTFYVNLPYFEQPI